MTDLPVDPTKKRNTILARRRDTPPRILSGLSNRPKWSSLNKRFSYFRCSFSQVFSAINSDWGLGGLVHLMANRLTREKIDVQGCSWRAVDNVIVITP